MRLEVNAATGESVQVDEVQVGPTPAQIEADQRALLPLVEIARLEAQVTQRRMREAALGIDGGWLAAQEALIAAQRALVV